MIVRPTIALCCIVKNEINNVDRLLASVKDCFDIIHITDTGSTDGTKEKLEEYQDSVPEQNPANTRIRVHYFEWINDFAAARNFSFSHAETDYLFWLDADDVLSNRQQFIDFRNTIMKLADFWIATYHYSFDDKGNPACSFARERVISRKHDFQWKYFIHEGIPPVSKLPVRTELVRTWTVNHLRSAEDSLKDRNRNLQIMESKKAEGKLDPRMTYYYGKELFEAGKHLEAFNVLVVAIAEEHLELHDRIMGIQYAAFSAMMLNQYDRAIQLAHQGLQLSPQRAEFFNIIGDCYKKLNRFHDAIPYFQAAPYCTFQKDGAGAIYQAQASYAHYPYNELARIYFYLGNMELANQVIDKALSLGPSAESQGIKDELVKVKTIVRQPKIGEGKLTDDIVISGHPTGCYEWDEETIKTNGHGGSETAAIRMARYLSDLSGRNVLIFNNRTVEKEFGKVKYIPSGKIAEYFSENIPYAHIAWRHNVKMTNAPTYIWNHDLGFGGLENTAQYEKIFCLSDFHKNFVKNLYNVPENKLHVTKNGIDPERFTNLDFSKVKGKVVFSSSPDRGIKEAIEAMDIVVSKLPFVTLHVYYGLDNMYKVGRTKEADELKALMASRPYVKFHGNVTQVELTKELAEAEVWLYPTNFLETFCITALEMLACKVYPVVRASWGAVQETIESQSGQKSAMVYQHEPQVYAERVIEAIEQSLWKGITFNPENASWKNVAQEWLQFLEAR